VLRPAATGNTTASRVKAMFLFVQEHHGRAEVDAFLAEAKLDRDYLDDETRPLAVERWHAALVAFASRFGRDAIRETVPAVVHPENLGVWTRVLRGAACPAAGFRQIDQYGTDEVRTEFFQTESSEGRVWHGRVVLRHDASYERDGLCALARAAELAAVPILFGLGPARVRIVPAESERSGNVVQRFEVEWREPGRVAAPAGAAAALIGSGAVAHALALHLGAGIAVTASATALGLIAGLGVAQEQRRRTQSRSQLNRIHALERAAALAEARKQSAAGFREGAVIAGQYRLGEKLGVGASGAIWEAVRLSDGQLVAIKLLRTAVAHDTVAADRLRREAAALGLAWHPNVVEIFEDGHLPDGTSYLVMERLQGESLAARLHRSGALGPAELLPLAMQVCDALGAVHAAGVVHRDLKPSNIFLAHGADGTGPVVKLLDFGIARVEWAETRLTNTGSPLGTPGYMSPEQEQGLEIDGRADLFALGGVLYECLSGQPPPVQTSELWAPPHSDGTESESGVQRALRKIQPLWRKLIERAMAPLPRDRYADSRALRDALSHVEGAKTARAKSSSG
jgi:Protein kinase domain